MTVLPDVYEAAVYLSSVPHPGEMAVLVCSDAHSALSAASVCRTRLECIRNQWNGIDWADWANAASVTV